jgi:hypothetical protein
MSMTDYWTPGNQLRQSAKETKKIPFVVYGKKGKPNTCLFWRTYRGCILMVLVTPMPGGCDCLPLAQSVGVCVRKKSISE